MFIPQVYRLLDNYAITLILQKNKAHILCFVFSLFKFGLVLYHHSIEIRSRLRAKARTRALHHLVGRVLFLLGDDLLVDLVVVAMCVLMTL